MTINCPGGVAYTIKAGDTLYAIALKFNTTVQSIIDANPGIDPMYLQVARIICVPQGVPVPPPRPRCQILNPTDLFPNSKGMIFIEPDLRSILALVTNIPAPSTLPDAEVYKLWISPPNSPPVAVTTMTESFPGYWLGRLTPNINLTGTYVLISAEKRSNITAPQGLGVAVGLIS